MPGSILEIPTVGEWGLTLLALILAALALTFLGRRGVSIPLVTAALLAATVASAVTLDGLTDDWSPGDLLASNGLVFYGKVGGDQIFFRVDTGQASNQPPTASNFTFETFGNTMLQLASAATEAPGVFVEGTLLSGASDPDGPLPLVASLVGSSPGAVVEVFPDGTFTYLPPAGAIGSDIFTYVVSDGFGATSPEATVTIDLVSRVWWVDNQHSGAASGRSHEPFTTLKAAEAASAPGDTLYVFEGDGTDTGKDEGIALQANQRLIGNGVALEMPFGLNGHASPMLLRGAGGRPLVSHLGTNGIGVHVEDVTGVEIRGLAVSSDGSAVVVDAIDSDSGAVVRDNVLVSQVRNGLRVDARDSHRVAIEVADNELTSGSSDGIEITLRSTSFVTGTIAGNTIHDTGGHGLFLDFPSQGDPGDPGNRGFAVLLIQGNRIENASQHALFFRMRNRSTARVSVLDNLLLGSGDDAVRVQLTSATSGVATMGRIQISRNVMEGTEGSFGVNASTTSISNLGVQLWLNTTDRNFNLVKSADATFLVEEGTDRVAANNTFLAPATGVDVTGTVNPVPPPFLGFFGFPPP